MTTFNGALIRSTISSLLEDETTGHLIQIWSKSEQDKISYIGFNFTQGQVESVKFYFTLFGPELTYPEICIPEMQNFLEKTWGHASPFLNQKYSNGGGLTFSIKMNSNPGLEYGCYLRCQDSAPFIFPPEYPDSPGLYFTIQNKQSQVHTYGYEGASSESQVPNSINMSQVQGIEVAKTNGHAVQKRIYLGSDRVLTAELEASIPHSIRQFVTQNGLQYVCPAFDMSQQFTSIYATRFSNQSILPSLSDIQFPEEF